MAVFNPAPNPTNDPNYLGASGGPIRKEVDRSSEALLKGVSNVLDVTIKATDNVIKTDIDKQVQAGVDLERAAIGTEVWASVAEEGGLRGPTELDGVINKVQNLYQGAAEGSVPYSYYLGRLNTIAKQIRAQYPGYREYIDNKMQSITGVDPANAQVAAILSEIESQNRANASEQTRALNLIKEKAEWFNDWPTVLQDYVSGKTDYLSIQQHVIIRESQEGQEVRNANALERARKAGTYNYDMTFKEASRVADVMVNNAMNAGIRAAGGIAAIDKTVMEAQASGRGMSATQATQLGLQYQAEERRMFNSLWQKLSTSPQFLDLKAEDKEKIITKSMTPFYQIRDAILAGEPKRGVVSSAANFLKAGQDDTELALRRSNPYWNKAAAIRSAGGDPAMNAWLLMGSGLDQQSKAIRDSEGINIMHGDPQGLLNGVQKVKEEEAIKGTPLPPKVYGDLVSAVTTITDPTMPLEQANKIAKANFNTGSRGVISLFGNKDDREATRAEQMKIYNQLFSEKMTQRLREIRTIDSQTWVEYQEMAKDEFAILFRNDVKDVQALVTGDAMFIKPTDVKVLLDDQTGKVKLIWMPADTQVRQMYLDNYARTVKPVVDRLNQGIERLQDILKDENVDVNGLILQNLMSMGFDPKAPVSESIISRITNAIAGYGKSFQEETKKRREGQK